MTDADAIERARLQCVATFTPPAPCHDKDYLDARREYHKLLVKYGLLDPKLADRRNA